MNKNTLPIAARLQSLQTASRFTPGGGRVIAEALDRNPIAQLLRAANETVLGRSLQFLSSGGPSLTLDVSGRRILRLSDAEGLPGAAACLGAEALEDEHKDDLIKLLQAVAAPRYELSVVSRPIGQGIEGVSVGLPVALLADLLLVELNDLGVQDEDIEQDQPEPDLSAPTLVQGAGGLLGRFAQGMGPILMAWLIVGGEDDGKTEGPEEMVSHLQGFLADETESLSHQLDLLSNVPGSPVCVTLGATLVEGHSVICARAGEGLLLGVVEGDATQALLKAWNAALG